MVDVARFGELPRTACLPAGHLDLDFTARLSQQHCFSRPLLRFVLQAGVHLVVKAARDIEDIDNLVVEGYLSQTEADAVKVVPTFQRAMVVWAWVGRACRESQQRGIVTGPFLAQLMSQCTKARGRSAGTRWSVVNRSARVG